MKIYIDDMTRKPSFPRSIRLRSRQRSTANPYAPAEFYARVGDTFGTTRPPGAAIVRGFNPTSKASTSATLLIRELLNFVGLPLPLRSIQAVLVFRFHFRAAAVTYALNQLRKHQMQIWLARKPIYEHAKETQVLCADKPSDAELRDLRKMLEDAKSILTGQLIKDAGEQWARRWMKANGFKSVTPLHKLGNVVIQYGKGEEGEAHALDIAGIEKSTGIAYGVSVKNQRHVLTRGKSAIADVYTKALAHRRKPMLFVPFVDEAVMERCLRDGIRLEVIGAQIVPAEDRSKRSMRSIINRLRPVVGPQPYVFMPKRDRL